MHFFQLSATRSLQKEFPRATTDMSIARQIDFGNAHVSVQKRADALDYFVANVRHVV